jgi:steroid 5-alpha reductase family enzyme
MAFTFGWELLLMLACLALLGNGIGVLMIVTKKDNARTAMQVFLAYAWIVAVSFTLYMLGVHKVLLTEDYKYTPIQRRVLKNKNNKGKHVTFV